MKKQEFYYCSLDRYCNETDPGLDDSFDFGANNPIEIAPNKCIAIDSELKLGYCIYMRHPKPPHHTITWKIIKIGRKYLYAQNTAGGFCRLTSLGNGEYKTTMPRL